MPDIAVKPASFPMAHISTVAGVLLTLLQGIAATVLARIAVSFLARWSSRRGHMFRAAIFGCIEHIRCK